MRYDRALVEQWVRDQTHYPEEETRRIIEEAGQRIIPSNIYHIGLEEDFATSALSGRAIISVCFSSRGTSF